MEPRDIWAALVRLVRRNTPNLVETPRLLWWQRGHGWVCEHRVALRGQLPQDSPCPVNCSWVELWFWNSSIKNTKSKSTNNCPFWAVVVLNHLFLADPGYSLGAFFGVRDVNLHAAFQAGLSKSIPINGSDYIFHAISIWRKNIGSGWWFKTFFIFHSVTYGMSSFPLTNLQDGYCTTNQGYIWRP
jgi:hypothetical protein